MDTGTIQNFKEWLDSKGEDIVGTPRSGECPYANYLNDINWSLVIARDKRITVGSKHGTESNDSQMYFSVVDPDVYLVSQELQDVLDKIDTLNGEVTGLQVLEVI